MKVEKVYIFQCGWDTFSHLADGALNLVQIFGTKVGAARLESHGPTRIWPRFPSDKETKMAD